MATIVFFPTAHSTPHEQSLSCTRNQNWTAPCYWKIESCCHLDTYSVISVCTLVEHLNINWFFFQMQQQPISAETADQACSNISRRRGLGKTTWPDRRHPRMLWIKATSPTPTSPAPAVNSTHRSGDVDKWRVFRWSRRRHGTTKGECHLSPNAGMSKGPCLLKADQSQQRSFIHLYISRIQINRVKS